MKFSTRNQVEALAKFHSDRFLTTSFYLDTDKGRLTRKEILLPAKNLLNEARTGLAALDAGKERKASLEKDLCAIERFLAGNMTSSAPGLAVFACSGENLWEVYDLPAAPRNRILHDQNPYIRPLALILDEHPRLLVLLLDRRDGKWYGSALGQITPVSGLSSDVPKKVKGGMEGQETKRVERHVEAAVHGHFKRAAQMTFDLLKKNGYGGLVVGCSDRTWSEFEPHLHAYVRERLWGRIASRLPEAPDKVLKDLQEAEKGLRAKAEDDLVARLVAELEKGGRARSGLRDCLSGLNKGEVQSLVVTRSFSAPGKFCPRCRLLYVDDLRCPSCERKTEPRPDIVDEAIEAALDRNCRVHHLAPPSKLDRYGRIGAFLRYKA